MDPLAFFFHLLGFILPALALAALMPLAARLVLPRARTGWLAAFTMNLVAGVATLAAGLWWLGRDGKMATYAALVLAVATSQWLIGRGWRA